MRLLWTLSTIFKMTHSLCFVDTVVGKPGRLTSTPPVIDATHCKTVCADTDTCDSFIFHSNICKLFAPSAKSFQCSNPYREMVKTREGCKGVASKSIKLMKTHFDIDMTSSLSDGYTLNPDLPEGTITVDVNIGESPPCGGGNNEIDAILINGTRAILISKADSLIIWDAKLGVWKFQSGNGKIYLRTVKCILKEETTELTTTTSTTTTTTTTTPTTTTKAGVSGGCIASVPLCDNCGFNGSNPQSAIVNWESGVLSCPSGSSGIKYGNSCDSGQGCKSVGISSLNPIRCVNGMWKFSGMGDNADYPSVGFKATCLS